MKRCPVSLQPDVESMLDWNSLTAEDFEPATQNEKEDFIQERVSVSYWKDAWRRLKQNTVAMVAMGVVIFLFLFAFVGPYLVPVSYTHLDVYKRQGVCCRRGKDWRENKKGADSFYNQYPSAGSVKGFEFFYTENYAFSPAAI